MAKRRPCSCSSCQILREIRKLQMLMMEVLGERPDERGEVPKGKDPARGEIAVAAVLRNATLTPVDNCPGCENQDGFTRHDTRLHGLGR